MSQHPPPQETPPEEPEITQEESVPSDGRDTEGEEDMKRVKNTKLEEPGGRDDKTPAKGV